MGLETLVDRIILKFRIKPKSIKQLLLPYTIIGWVTGRGIIECPLGNRWPVTSCIYSLVLVLGFCATINTTLDKMDTVMLSTSAVGSLMLSLALCINLCVVICNILNGWKSTNGIKIIVDSFEVSGKKMEKLGILQDYRSLYRRPFITLICEILFVIYTVVATYIFAPSDIEMVWYEVAAITALHYPIIVVAIGDAAFITLVRSLSLRFQQLNKVLKQMSTTTDDSPQHERVLEHTILNRRNVDYVFVKHTNDDPDVMRMALEDHYELVRIGNLINKTLGTQALLSMTLAFYMLIGLLYRASALLLWSTANKDIVDGEVVTLLSWVIFNGYKIINMTSACAKASDECKETAVIICQLHEPSTSKAFRDEISDFSLQMTQHTLEFTACGLFPLNHSLIHGMVGSITTYLVILVQIGDTSTSGLLASSTKTTTQ